MLVLLLVVVLLLVLLVVLHNDRVAFLPIARVLSHTVHRGLPPHRQRTGPSNIRSESDRMRIRQRKPRLRLHPSENRYHNLDRHYANRFAPCCHPKIESMTSSSSTNICSDFPIAVSTINPTKPPLHFLSCSIADLTSEYS